MKLSVIKFYHCKYRMSTSTSMYFENHTSKSNSLLGTFSDICLWPNCLHNWDLLWEVSKLHQFNSVSWSLGFDESLLVLFQHLSEIWSIFSEDTIRLIGLETQLWIYVAKNNDAYLSLIEAATAVARVRAFVFTFQSTLYSLTSASFRPFFKVNNRFVLP